LAVTQGDFIHSLGLPFLAHRLRRLSELLVVEEEPVMREADLLVPARGSSTMLLLSRKGPLTVTQIARELRLSHPLIIRIVRALETVGYVAGGNEQPDRRSRRLVLTALGAAKAKELEEFNQVVAEAYRWLFRAAEADLFAAVEATEPVVRNGALAARLRKLHLGASGKETRLQPAARCDVAQRGRRIGLY
jgi:DNA-binding MarR family transcriptional regulator